MQPHNWKCHPKKATLEMDSRKKSTVKLISCDEVKQTKVPSHDHPLSIHLSTTAQTSLLSHAPERCLQAFINAILFWLSLCTHWMCVVKSGENGCWQHETLDPSTLSERSAAAYFIWKSMPQNAVNCQTSDFGSYCYAQNSEKPRRFGSGMGAKGRNKWGEE